MNERERLLAVLEGGRADQIPWYGDLSWWHAAHTEIGDLPQTYRDEASDLEFYQSHFQLTPTTGEGYLKLHQDTGIGVMFYSPMVWRETFSGEIRFASRKEGNVTFSKIITPVGEMESVDEYLPGAHTSASRSHYIKQPDDLKVIRYVWEHRQITPSYEEFKRIDRLWDSAGIPFALGPICSAHLQTLITRWAGIETTVAIVVEAPEQLEETLEVMEAADDAIFEAIAHSPARVVEFPDNIAGELTGTNLLRKYVLPYWIKRIKQLQAKGKIVGVHNDGGCKAALPVIIEAGFDFVEAVTPAPAGDMTLEEIRKATDGRIIVMGGLPGVFFSPMYGEEYFADFVQQALSTFPKGEGFVLDIADQVPPDGEFSRMCLVREILDKQ